MAQQETLWINHDAEHMKALPHRHRVFSHIQNVYLKQKRKEKVKYLRTSAKVPDVSKWRTHARRKDVLGRTPKPEPVVEDVDQDTPCELVPVKHHPLSPVTILNAGDSDPFDAYAIPISAEVNNILAFYRDFIIPSAYHLDGKSKHNLATARSKSDWDACVNGLRDEGEAFAFMGRNSAVAADVSQSQALRQKSLIFRTKSTMALRKKLSVVTNANQSSLYWHIYMLWTAEIAAHNVTAARVHGTMLSKLVKGYFRVGGGLFDKLETGLTMIELMLYLLYGDTAMATQLLTRPVFDVYEWLPTMFKPFASLVATVLPPSPPDLWHLDSAIDSEDFASSIRTCREVFGRWRANSGEGVNDKVATIRYGWGQYQWCIAFGRLMERYCDFKELSEAASGTLDYCYAQQYMALSAVKWGRALTFEIDVCGKRVYEGDIMEGLREALEKSDRPTHSLEWQKWKKARLWAFYIGATTERRHSRSSNGLFHGWFHERFACQVHDMGLLGWEDTTQILNGFLFDSSTYEQERRWFEETVK
ncbi:hypothetical protein H2200_008313 [Cladophialophora chaetospira]|uniref:Uncharacterized protein n=1 Tax=Cladophialophora chaetospira TaxID=386627 RepID=A0AA39CGG8_9EURO|nr:hypothetical protein H2200_008313 [Cladophialophora chaetospira]